DRLSRLPARRFSRARNRTKADLLLVDREREDPLVVKDFRPRGFIVRNTIGRFSVARECRAYERLAGIEGIPAFAGRVDAHARASLYRRGEALTSRPRRSLPASFFEALEELLAAVHARGVAIADLHHRNVIVDPGAARPSLVDFSLAVVRPAGWNLPGRWL